MAKPMTENQAHLRAGCPGSARPAPLNLAARAGPAPPGVRGVRKQQGDLAWRDKLLFCEYFHADNGAGPAVMQQTGWTALLIDLIADPPGATGP